MEEDADLNNENLEEQQKEQSLASKKTTENVQKKIQERLSKSAVKNAGKQTLLKLLMPIITYVAIFIIILIIIIGIAMFFITMPGMAVEKLKEIANDVGDAVSSWFGENEAEQISDAQIYETLDYLEQMTFDLKGDGFLTDYVGEAKDGVERSGDDQKISKAESDFIKTYLVSDKYIYTIKNFNMVAGNWILGALQHFASFFTEGDSNQYWSRGMIEIRLDNGILGNEQGEYYSVYDLGSINIDAEKKTLEIKRGWFNNSMTYNLDGWTGRYGMPLDFLISVHMSTMMPDLAYDLATSFNTVIQLLLHPVGGSGTTAVGLYKVDEDTYISYDDFKEYTGIKIVSREDAKEVMDKYGIESPNNCIGTSDVGIDNIEPSSEDMKNISVKLETDESDSQDVIDSYNGFINELKTNYSVTDEILQNNGLPVSISSLDEFKNLLEEQPPLESTNYIFYTYSEPSREKTYIVRAYINDETYESYYIKIQLVYNNYSQKIESSDGSATVTFHNAGVIYDIDAEWSQEKMNKWLEENNINTEEEAKCSHLKDEKKACKNCQIYIQAIYDEVKIADVSNLDLYEPYISKVENHWFRDVYFVIDDGKDKVVENDYDYEAIIKERWTLYETYDEDDGEPELVGEYKYYTTSGALYVGTAEEAAANGIKVSKKAKTTEISDIYSDLNWQEINGKYSAYKLSSMTEPVTTKQKVYPNLNADDPNFEIKDKIYVDVITTGSVVQTGEGQRTETNDEIKKMFLENTYFRYDGTQERAEAITKLRKEHDISYGSLKDSDLKKSIEIDGKEYTVEQLSGQVSLNQDSLNAFGMLENEHTLDADYIYRDFKELLVELGYFKKQELTDETPRVMQWLIPDIGSYGYPARNIDKNEHVYGTMVHSKGDIDVSKEQTIKAVLDEFLKAEGTGAKNTNNANNTKTSDNTKENVNDEQKNNSEQYAKDAWINEQTKTNLVTVGAISAQDALDGSNKSENQEGDYSSSVSGVSVDEFLEKAREVCEYMDNEGYDYCVENLEDCTHKGYADSCGLQATFEDSKSKRNVCCATLVSWVLKMVEVDMSGCGNINYCPVLVPYLVEQLGGEVITEYENLQPGDILCYIHKEEEGRFQHVDILGEEEGDGFIKYNGGGYVDKNNSSIQQFNKSEFDSEALCFGVRLFGEVPKEGEPYEGYQGNEAVVSPVTGILLKYGTYTDEGIDKKYRENADLKYGTKTIEKISDESTKDNINNKQNINNQEKVPIDKVGYAEILVLDTKKYAEIENRLINSTRWNDSFLKNGKINEIKDLTEEQVNDKENSWSDLDKILYNAALFTNLYEEFDIAGNTVYIDGFKCELPQEEFDIEADEKAIPDGKDLNKEYFKSITLNDFSNGNISNEDDILISKYEKDEDYKMASNRATDKLNTESLVKNDAISSLYLGDDLILIKEGTVIGRTMTDYEILKGRGTEDKYSEYRATKDSEKDIEEKIIGNYLRIEMRDNKKELVENVEDYMKLDEEGSKGNDYDFEFFFWAPYEGGPWGSFEKYAEDYDDPGGRASVGCGPTIIEIDSKADIANGATWSIAVGIAQWTNNSKGLNNLSDLCTYLSEYDPMLSSLKDFAGKDYEFYTNNIESFKETWHNICKTQEGYDKMLEAQMSYVYDEEWLVKGKDISQWAQERPMAVQGHIFSVQNWGNYNYNGKPMLSYINSSQSDIDIINTLGEIAHDYGQSHSVTQRFDSQSKFAVDLVNGKVTEEQLMEWIETKIIKGLNPGYGEESVYTFPVSSIDLFNNLFYNLGKINTRREINIWR